MDSAIVAVFRAKLPVGMREGTKKSYSQNLLYVARRLLGKTPTTASLAWVNQKKNYERLPDLVKNDKDLKSPYTRYYAVNTASAWATHIGAKRAHDFWFHAATELKEERNVLMRQEDSGPTYKANKTAYKDLVDRVHTELLPAFAKLYRSHRQVSQGNERRIVIRMLIGALNVVEPQCRSAYAGAKIVEEEPDSSQLGDGKTNLVWIPEEGNVRFYCNTDKISGKSGSDSWELRDDASRIVRQSYEIYPRVFLFPKSLDNDTPMSAASYLAEIGKTFRFDDKVAAANIIRHSIINHFYDEYPSPTLAQKEWLARRMRHSWETQETIYRKLEPGQITHAENDVGLATL